MRVAPKTACVKNATPAYITATNQRLLLSDESASIVSGATAISTSENSDDGGNQKQIVADERGVSRKHAAAESAARIAGTQVTSASAAISTASFPAAYCVRVTGRER